MRHFIYYLFIIYLDNSLFNSLEWAFLHKIIAKNSFNPCNRFFIIWIIEIRTPVRSINKCCAYMIYRNTFRLGKVDNLTHHRFVLITSSLKMHNASTMDNAINIFSYLYVVRSQISFNDTRETFTYLIYAAGSYTRNYLNIMLIKPQSKLVPEITGNTCK